MPWSPCSTRCVLCHSRVFIRVRLPTPAYHEETINLMHCQGAYTHTHVYLYLYIYEYSISPCIIVYV